MPLVSCHECGASVSSHSAACMKCGAPGPAAAYRPLPPRPPAKPERSGWWTAAGWGAALAGCVLFGLLLIGWAAEIDRRVAAEKAELARDEEHLRKVIAWARDTSDAGPLPGGAGRPAPTSDRAKRAWVIGRMLEDEWVWKQGILVRHGADPLEPPRAWGTARYQANARSYPEVGRHLEGRVAALAEIEGSAAAWLEEHAAALERESGMPAREIRSFFSRDFGRVPEDQTRAADAMLEIHRHFVRVDPRVRYEAGTGRVLFASRDELRRTEELAAKLRSAMDDWKRAEEKRTAEGVAALYRELQ